MKFLVEIPDFPLLHRGMLAEGVRDVVTEYWKDAIVNPFEKEVAMNIEVQEFSPTAVCPKCGAGAMPRHEMDSEFVPAVLGNSFVAGPGLLRTRYCPGGQEPESTVADNPVAAFAQLIAGKMGTDVSSLAVRRINICAGIGTEHLHKTCVVCEFEFLMEVKNENAQA